MLTLSDYYYSLPCFQSWFLSFSKSHWAQFGESSNLTPSSDVQTVKCSKYVRLLGPEQPSDPLLEADKGIILSTWNWRMSNPLWKMRENEPQLALFSHQTDRQEVAVSHQEQANNPVHWLCQYKEEQKLLTSALRGLKTGWKPSINSPGHHWNQPVSNWTLVQPVSVAATSCYLAQF